MRCLALWGRDGLGVGVLDGLAGSGSEKMGRSWRRDWGRSLVRAQMQQLWRLFIDDSIGSRSHLGLTGFPLYAPIHRVNCFHF